MPDRDVTKVISKDEFVAALRRLADSLERGEAHRIQVAQKRFTVPQDAELSIEHELDGGDHELELQLRWREG